MKISWIRIFGGAALVAGALALGCNKSSKNEKPATAKNTAEKTATTGKSMETAGKKAAETSEASADAAKIKANLAKLDPADAKLAAEQRVCPVSGDLLGEMSPPVKMDVKGHAPVFLCCPNCKEKFRAEQKMYVAKVDKAMSATETEGSK